MHAGKVTDSVQKRIWILKRWRVSRDFYFPQAGAAAVVNSCPWSPILRLDRLKIQVLEESQFSLPAGNVAEAWPQLQQDVSNES